MKIKSDFLLREIAGVKIIVPVGSRVIDFKGLIMINELGAFIWDKLQVECTFDVVLDSILDNYEIDTDIAKTDLEEFLTMVRKNGALDE